MKKTLTKTAGSSTTDLKIALYMRNIILLIGRSILVWLTTIEFHLLCNEIYNKIILITIAWLLGLLWLIARGQIFYLPVVYTVGRARRT